MNATVPAYMELVDFVARGATAEEVANFRPSPEAQKRVAELLERQRESELTEEETAELDGFVQLEHILGLARAKAQLILAGRCWISQQNCALQWFSGRCSGANIA